MVLTTSLLTQNVIQKFLNSTNKHEVNSIAEDYDSDLFFLLLNKYIDYVSNTDQYLLTVTQRYKIGRRVEGGSHISLMARNSFVELEYEWSGGTDLGVSCGAHPKALSRYFDTVEDAEEFYDELIEDLKNKLENMIEKYDKADRASEEDIVLTGAGKIDYNSKVLKTEEKEDGDEESRRSLWRWFL